MQPHSIEPQQEEEDRPKANWKRRILIGAACLLGLLVVGWWIISSEMFLRGVVIKKIGKAIHAEITFKSADWSPRRSVVLRGVRMKAIGQEPCLEASEITVNFRLGDLLAGKVDLGDIKIVEPIISIHMDAEGKTNLDPFFEQRKKPGKPTQVEIGQFVIQQGALNFHRQFHSGSDERVTVRHLDIRGENIGNKRAGKLIVSAGLQYVLQRAGVEVADKLEGSLSFECEQELNLRWLPESIAVHTKVLVEKSSGQFAFANGLVANLETRLTPTELKHFQLDFQHEGNSIGNLLLSGPVDFLKGSANLHVAVNGIDGQVLNFVGRSQGLDFHETVLSSTNRLVLSGYGKQIKLHGAVRATPVRISLDRVSLPSVDALEMQYDFTVDLAGKRASFDALSLNATHKAKHFLTGEINQPMTLAWGGDVIEAPDSEFIMKLMNTDMADWQPWLGRFAKSGAVTASVKIVVENNGREIRFDSWGSIASLQIPMNENEIKVGNFDLNATGQIIDFNKFEFSQFKAEAGRPDKGFFSYEGRPTVNLETKVVMDSNSKFEGELPILFSWFPQKGMSCETGRATYNGALTVKLNQPRKQTIAGTVHWENVNGVIETHKLDRLAGTADLNLTLAAGHQLHIDRFSADASVAGQLLVAKVSLGGDWDLRNGAVDLKKMNLLGVDLVQLKTVIPFRGVESGSGDLRLESLKFEPGKNAFFKGTVHLTDVILTEINGAAGHFPKDKLKVETDLDLAVFSRGRKWEVHAKKSEVKIFVNNRSAGQATLVGQFNSETQTGKYNLNVSKVDHWVVNLLPKKWRGGVKMKSGRVEAMTAKGKAENGLVSYDISTDLRAVAIEEGQIWWWPKKPMDIIQQLTGTHQLGSGANFEFTTNEGTITRGGSVIAAYNSPINLKDGKFLLNLKSLHIGPAFTAQAIQNWFPGHENIAGSLYVRKSELRFPSKSKVLFTGELEFSDFIVPPHVAEAPSVSVGLVISGSVDLAADENGSWLPTDGNLNGTIKRRKKPAGRITLKVNSRGSYTAVAENLDVSVLRLAEPIWPQAWGIISGRGGAQVELGWGAEAGLSCEGSWKMKDWVVRDRSRKESRPISASGEFDMNWKGEILNLKQCSVNLGKSELAKNRVIYSGFYNFSDPQKVTGEIKAVSDGVELLPVLRIIDAEPLSAKSGGLGVSVDIKLKVKHLYWNGLEAVDFNASARVTNKNTVFREMKAGCLRWNGLEVTDVNASATFTEEIADFQKMKAGHLRWNGLEATDVNASATFTKEISNFRRIRMNLGGGLLNATYKQDRTSKQIWNHDVTVAGRRVELKPLLGLFVEGQHKPWVSAQKWGRLGARIRLQWPQGPGMDWDWRTVRAEGLKGVGSDAILNVSSAAITIPKRDEAKVGFSGILLKIPAALEPLFVKENKLNEVKINSIKLQGRIVGGKVSARFRAGTEYYKVATGGKAIMLAKRLGDTEVSNLPVQITLKPEMAKEFRSRLLDNGKELPLPVFLKINGKINDLQVKEDPVILVGLIARALSNKPFNVAVDALEEASGVIDKILPVNPLNILFPREK